MTLLSRADVQPAAQPTETVPAPALGGDVIVRGITLSDRLAIASLIAPDYAPRAGESAADARARAGAAAVAHYLARAVVLEDGLPLYTAAEWEYVGARHIDATMELYRVAKRLAGMDAEETQKN